MTSIILSSTAAPLESAMPTIMKNSVTTSPESAISTNSEKKDKWVAIGCAIGFGVFMLILLINPLYEYASILYILMQASMIVMTIYIGHIIYDGGCTASKAWGYFVSCFNCLIVAGFFILSAQLLLFRCDRKDNKDYAMLFVCLFISHFIFLICLVMAVIFASIGGTRKSYLYTATDAIIRTVNPSSPTITTATAPSKCSGSDDTIYTWNISVDFTSIEGVKFKDQSATYTSLNDNSAPAAGMSLNPLTYRISVAVGSAVPTGVHSIQYSTGSSNIDCP